MLARLHTSGVARVSVVCDTRISTVASRTTRMHYQIEPEIRDDVLSVRW